MQAAFGCSHAVDRHPPESVELQLTVRTFSAKVRDQVRERIVALAEAQAQSYGATAKVQTPRGYPVLVNRAEETRFAREVAHRIVFMDQGVIVEEGSPQQIFDAPRTDRLKAFLKHFSPRL